MSTTINNDISRIRQLNNEFRATFKDSDVIETSSIRKLNVKDHAQVISIVKNFTGFSDKTDDDYSFGVFFYKDEKFMFKIDYYDKNKLKFSKNPADDKVTRRVITIMRARSL